jgi:hypothetical protein
VSSRALSAAGVRFGIAIVEQLPITSTVSVNVPQAMPAPGIQKVNMSQSKESSNRWMGDRTDTQPRGEVSFAQSALALLGPFQDENHRQIARQLIETLAINLNHKIQANEGAPRDKDVVEELGALVIGLCVAAELADTSLLARVLSSLSDAARIVILSYGTGLDNPTRVVEQHPQRVPLDGLFSNSNWEDGRTIAELKAIARSIHLSTELWKRRHPDKGGKTSSYKRLVGEPRFALVREGFLVFEKYRPGTAMGTVDGKFHEFLMDIFEYATGLNRNDHSKLENWTRRLPKIYRRMLQIQQIELQLETEAESIQRTPGGPSDVDRLALARILDRADSLKDEYTALWETFYCGRSLKPRD